MNRYGAQVAERKSVAIRAGLEALCVLLKLCSSPDCPRHLLDQDSLETCCKFLAQQARCSLLVFFDATLALELRPDTDKSKYRPTYEPAILIPSHCSQANMLPKVSYVCQRLVLPVGCVLHSLAQMLSVTVQLFCACRANENRGKLTHAGAMVYDLLGAVVDGLRLLSHNVALENPGFNNMMRILARVLHVPALATLHSPIIGVFYPVCMATVCHCPVVISVQFVPSDQWRSTAPNSTFFVLQGSFPAICFAIACHRITMLVSSSVHD